MPMIDSQIKLYLGDCLDVLPDLKHRSIDLILCDPPYGTTACPWDSVIDLEELWPQLRRLIKHRRNTVLFGMEPFSSLLRIANFDQFRYDWCWEKTTAGGFMNAKVRPLKTFELISVFCLGRLNAGRQVTNTYYFPQGLIKTDRLNFETGRSKAGMRTGMKPKTYLQKFTNYPKDLLKFSSESNPVHPTQKPVALMEYLIKTYTNENDLVLDFAMGSGTTGVACVNLNRRFIGIEKDPEYFKIAKERIYSVKSKT